MIQTPKPYAPPSPDLLTTVYADARLVVCDKPSGLLSVPGRGPEKAVCASAILRERYGEILIVHRLDMDTSGLMIFARTKDAQRALSMAFEKRRVRKQYEALVQGAPDADEGTINAAIARHSRQRPLRHLDPDGREAITHWRILERHHGFSRVLLSPETGRSHQLRLHMASLGHPILGDGFYGDETSHQRLCLHAKSLAFPHPENGETVQVECPAPF